MYEVHWCGQSAVSCGDLRTFACASPRSLLLRVGCTFQTYAAQSLDPLTTYSASDDSAAL